MSLVKRERTITQTVMVPLCDRCGEDARYILQWHTNTPVTDPMEQDAGVKDLCRACRDYILGVIANVH